MARCHNNDASFCRKRIKNCYNGGGVAWSDLNHDVLYLVMMRLGFVEFFSFSGVCKSLRSLALSNRKSFMASRPPMIMHTDEDTWYLEDFEGREFKTIIPRSVGMGCAGLACGYLIFFCEKTHDIWLVNPITRHELHFPDVPFHVDHSSKKGGVRAVLVFSPSINGWVFVITNRYTSDLWFCIVGKGVWNHVTCGIYHFMDLHAFKGRIYTLHLGGSPIGRRHIRELRFDPVPKLTELETHFLEPSLAVNFISSDENLFLFAYTSRVTHMIHKLRFDDMYCLIAT